MKTETHYTEIDYLFEDCTDLVAYVIKWITPFHCRTYSSPFIYENIEDAFDGAIQDLAN